MNNNDLIRRGDATAHPFANGQYDHDNANKDFIRGYESYKEWLEDLPTVSQPMSAVEYARHRARLCKQYYRTRHEKDCPLCGVIAGCGGCGAGWSEITSEAVAIIEKWVQEHPEGSVEDA